MGETGSAFGAEDLLAEARKLLADGRQLAALNLVDRMLGDAPDGAWVQLADDLWVVRRDSQLLMTDRQPLEGPPPTDETPPAQDVARQGAKDGSLADHLRALVDYYADDIAQIEGSSERARWSEFVVTYLASAKAGDIMAVRRAVGVLDYLGLTRFDRLAGGLSEQETATMIGVVEAHDLGPGAADAATSLVSVAPQIAKEFGSPQGMLSAFGGALIQSIMSAIEDQAGLSDSQLRAAITTWLQNTMSLPVLLETSELHQLRGRYEADERQLSAVADDLDLNVALLDDLAASASGDEGFERYLRAMSTEPESSSNVRS